MEKYLNRAKLQKNIAMGCLVFAFIALFAIIGDDSGENNMLMITVAVVITAMVLLAFSYNNIKKTQRMGNAEAAIIMANKSEKVDNARQKKTKGNKIALFATLVIALVLLVGGIAIYCVMDGTRKGDTMNSGKTEKDLNEEAGADNVNSINEKLTESERQEVIHILNSTQYVDNVVSNSYGQVIESAFIDYDLEYKKKSESVVKVSVSGIFMANPTSKSNYQDLERTLGEDKALELYKGIVYRQTIVFEVDMDKKTCKNVYGTENATLKAYALESFY